MKKDDLFRALRDIDDRYIEEADQFKRKKKRYVFALGYAAAAVLFVIFLGVGNIASREQRKDMEKDMPKVVDSQTPDEQEKKRDITEPSRRQKKKSEEKPAAVTPASPPLQTPAPPALEAPSNTYIQPETDRYYQEYTAPEEETQIAEQTEPFLEKPEKNGDAENAIPNEYGDGLPYEEQGISAEINASQAEEEDEEPGQGALNEEQFQEDVPNEDEFQAEEP